MICNVYWNNRPPTPAGWEPEEEHGIARKIQRETHVVGFIRDGVRIEVDHESDLEYLKNKYTDLRFELQ